jgi:hypothetical protein
MSTANQQPLGNFEQRLLTELTAHLKAPPAPALGRTARIRPGISFWRPGGGALTTVAAVAAAVVVVVFSGRHGVQPALARAFPIVTQPPQQLPAYMQRALQTQELVSRGYPFDHDRAYAFQTPTGIGYVVVDRSNKWLCILISDLDASRASIRCETSGRLLARNSIGLQLSTRDHGEHQLVWLLPSGSTATTVSADGALRPVVLENGLLAIVTQHPVTIMTTVHGRQTTTVYPSH